MISPLTAYSGPHIVAVEFGPLDTTIETWAKRGASDSGERTSEADATSDDGELAKLMQAARKHGKHVKDKRVGYYDIGGMKIELDNEHDDERNRQFYVDGKIVSIEKGGWIVVREVDCEVEGVLDLLGIEWEESENTPSEAAAGMH